MSSGKNSQTIKTLKCIFYPNKQMNKCILRDLEYNSGTQTVTKLLTYVQRHTDSPHSSIHMHSCPVQYIPPVRDPSVYTYVLDFTWSSEHLSAGLSNRRQCEVKRRHKYLICCLAQWVSIYNCTEKRWTNCM